MWETPIEKAYAPILRYIREKHQMGLIELGGWETVENEIGVDVYTAASTYFVVMLPELRRLCLENKLHMKNEITLCFLPGEAQVGSSQLGVREEEGRQIYRNLYRPVRISEHAKLMATLRVWALPHLVPEGWGLDGDRQGSFIHWTDTWWRG